MIELHDDCFDNRFTIEILYGGIYSIYASCLQDAIDVLIDYFDTANKEALEDKAIAPYSGYFLTDEEIKEYEEEDRLDEFLYGGNYCQYLSFQWHEVRVQEVFK
jgi:hypothetical protein